jgi:WD40 repeat protein
MGNVPITLDARALCSSDSQVGVADLDPWRTVTFSPDGKFVLTDFRGCGPNAPPQLIVWDAATGKCLKQLEGSWAAVSPDNNVITSSGVWKTGTWNKHAIPLDGDKGTLSPDGQWLVTISRRPSPFAHLWHRDTDTWRRRTELRRPPGSVRHVEFSPNNTFVVGIGEDSKVTVWRAETGESETDLNEHTAKVLTARFSSDNAWVVTADEDYTTRLWEARTWQCVAVWPGQKKRVRSATFSPDARLVLTISDDGTSSEDSSSIEDGTVQMWAVKAGDTLPKLEPLSAIDVRFSPDGKWLLTYDLEGNVRLWDMSTGRSIADLRGHEGFATTCDFSKDATRRVVIGSADGKARIYSCEVCASLGDLLALAQKRVTRDLTPEESEKYLHEPLSK